MPVNDDAYANGAHIPDGASFPDRWVRDATAFRDAMGARAQLGLRYGPSPRQNFDLFEPERTAKGTLIFVHGGFWRMLSPQDWSHLAAGAVARGWTVALPGYELCPDVRIAGITQSIAQAVQVIAGRTTGPLALAGHSAGGHLVARMCANGMLPADVAARVRHVMPISPLSDLEPLLLTAMNDDFQMDAGMARAESPVYQPAPERDVTVWVGGAERPAFLDQARWLAEAWRCGHHIAAGKHHFDVVDPLTEPDSAMLQRLLG
ncbi:MULTISPECIES: alpha/beta hydrolase [Roseobacteraceae]|uniref:Alpha/beta hydrolase fold protein n=1 Tax=Pseudosulfitobacter pseudonitzschiae TaxID=1402135 RepID=A0A221K5A0_9RHOB|nr:MULTISPECIES: alpha/beta hydrolase [Roseobacteraceae]ASM74188.1 alpha/beta hydrolase fold protein [Pseudosulfitobacter pseudonitzschiae]